MKFTVRVLLFCLLLCTYSAGAQQWSPLGPSDQNASCLGTTSYQDMAIDTAGTAYIIYVDGFYGSRISVKKFTGGDWAYVGDPNFAAYNANTCAFSKIAIAPDNTPYIF